MNRRHALATLAAALPAFAFAAETRSSVKKGWAGANPKFHQLFGAKWYYTWSPKTRSSKSLEFVPMIKGEWSLKQVTAIRKMGGISHLLGFNEPERKKQGNLSLDRAIQLWPRLVELADARKLRLGSPAPSSDKDGIRWLREFMDRAEKQHLRVDFIAVHWYRSRNADEFENFIDGLAKDYKRPIWITEFNGWSGPEEEHYKFLRESLHFLEKSRHVERYAYMNPGSGKAHSLVKPDGTPTRLGELYRDAGA